MELKTDIQKQGDYVIVSAIGELDDFHAPDFNDLLMDLIKEGVTKVIINLEKAAYVDSIGLGTIAIAAKKLSKVGGVLAIVCAKPQIVKLLDASGMVSMIKRNIGLYDTVALAIENVQDFETNN